MAREEAVGMTRPVENFEFFCLGLMAGLRLEIEDGLARTLTKLLAVNISRLGVRRTSFSWTHSLLGSM